MTDDTKEQEELEPVPTVRYITCPLCEGKGESPNDKNRLCAGCDGDGSLPAIENLPPLERLG